MSFVLPKCATSSVRSVPCELARTSAFRSMGWYSTAKAASANRIKIKRCGECGSFSSAHPSFGGSIWARCRWAMKKPTALAANTI